MLSTLFFVLQVGLRALTLQMPDAADLKQNEYAATIALRPASMLVMVYAEWPDDKGAAQQYVNLVRELGHTDLYVRFHADPNPIAYSARHGGPEAWGKLCAYRMASYYSALDADGVHLHAMLANEYDAASEGGLNPHEASVWLAAAMRGYQSIRPQDTLHVPATSGSPDTLLRYLEQYRGDGWVETSWWVDGHGYGTQLGQVVDVLNAVYPDHDNMISETNNGSLIEAARAIQGHTRAVSYFTLNWARGGEGRLAPVAMDREQHISLMLWADKYDEFLRLQLQLQPQPQER